MPVKSGVSGIFGDGTGKLKMQGKRTTVPPTRHVSSCRLSIILLVPGLGPGIVAGIHILRPLARQGAAAQALRTLLAIGFTPPFV
jgi:hypothetical protein